MYPSNKETLWPGVLIKLDKLGKGLSEVPKATENEKVDAARVAADKAAEEIHSSSPGDVVHIDAEAEAAKESWKKITYAVKST
ncbi:hypothetical protein ACA910_019439 [Epithemia clementina (nom. ined.)]